MSELKTVVITGGNTSLGYQCAKNIALLDKSWHIVLACRNKTRALEAVEKLKQETNNFNIQEMVLDLSSLVSIRNFTDNFLKQELPPLKALVCNAGVQVISGINYTKDGFESTFGVNHLGHFLLTNLLLKSLKSPARIVFVSSGTHYAEKKTGMPPPNYTNAEKLAYPENTESNKSSFMGRQRYSTSKLCNIFCTYELAKKLEGKEIMVNAFDPGLMPGTGLARDYGIIQKFAWNYILPVLTLFVPNVNTVEHSGKALARLILDDKLQSVTGKYFEGFKEIPSSKESYDNSKAKELWETSEKLVKLTTEEKLTD